MKKGLLLLSVLTLVGCAGNSGNQKLAKMDRKDIDSQIKVNETTKEYLLNVLGEPTSVDFLATGEEKWVYEHVRVDARVSSFIPVVNWFDRGTNDTKRSLIVIFNNEGKVKKYAFNKHKGVTKIGAFS